MAASRIFGRLAGSILVLLSVPAAATERSLAIVKDNALQRIAVQQEELRLVARAQASALICVAHGGQRYWAKPEAWMTGVKTYDERPTTPTGDVSGGGNGMGSLRSLPAIAQDKCVQ